MDKRLLGYINWALLACMLLLYFTGVANLYSASGTRVETGFAFESFYQRQLVWGLCGLGCMLLTTLFDYRQLRNLAWPAYLIFLVLLMLVPLVGSTFYGAKRWISFGLFTIQPSEPIKIAVLILVARLLARDSQPLGWKNFFSVLAVGLVPVVFILKQPDLGTAMMVLLIMGGMILFHGLRRYVLGTCLLAVPGVAALMCACSCTITRSSACSPSSIPATTPWARATTSCSRASPSVPASCGARATWKA